MKRMIFAVLLIIAFSTTAFSREFVASGKTHTALGDYKIEKADNPVIINGEKLKTYVISYQNSPMEVKLVIQKGKRCKNYIVLSDELSIQYVCNDNYFGVEKLPKTLKSEGLSTSDAGLDRTEYFRQKVITPGQNSELDNAQLVAAYFPMLLKNSGEKIIAEAK